MKDKIMIDIVSDVVCPWCIIGYKRLEKAIVEMGIQDKVEIEWQPFELNSNMPVEGENIDEHISRKYGTRQEDNTRSKAQLSKLGAELNFKFDYFDTMKMPNTRDAHILIEYAKENGKQTEMNLRLVEAFFSERKDISSREVLIQELKRIGLDEKEGLARLENESYREQIKVNEAVWQNKGVRSVPTIVFNAKSALTGAQPIHVYKQVLADLIK
ncbi:MAG: DsbA family oxidoreductase [Paludibacter sp.]|nr:DsbA family oxidoreductase [Paludibacter sp.]